MNPKLKAALAVIAGLVAGTIVIFGLEMLTSERPPEGIDFNDKVAVKAWMDSLPATAFVILVLAYFLGSVAAGYVTNLVARGTGYKPALVAGFGLFAAGVANLIQIPQPVWFAIVSSLMYFAGAWIGGRIANQQAAKAAEQ